MVKNMSKKVGILTFHRSRNYGAVLQTYALTKSLEKTGLEVQVVDYQNPLIEEQLMLWNAPEKTSVQSIIYTVKQFVFRLGKKIAFDRFIRKYIPLSFQIGSEKEKLKSLSEIYDVCITGSDQVWNGKLTDNDMSYYLDFCEQKTKKIAYAVSVGDDIDSFNTKGKDSIKEFSVITVRENILKDYLFENYHIKAELACDPTLLLTFDDYKKFLKPQIYKEKYLFLYTIQDSPKLQEFAGKIAKEKKLKIISNKNSIPFWLHCSPKDFLNWIYNAEYIITNSFHGTVFSIHFHKQFLSYVQKENGMLNQRIFNLLENVNLLERSINDIEDIDVNEAIHKINEAIHYNKADKKLNDLREKSEHSLMKNI